MKDIDVIKIQSSHRSIGKFQAIPLHNEYQQMDQWVDLASRPPTGSCDENWTPSITPLYLLNTCEEANRTCFKL